MNIHDNHYHMNLILIDEVLEKKKKKGHILNIRERQMKCLGHIMRKVGFKNLVLTGPTEYKRDG